MKHLKKITIAKANSFDDLADWIRDNFGSKAKASQ
jgi:hypothetical protein